MVKDLADRSAQSLPEDRSPAQAEIRLLDVGAFLLRHWKAIAIGALLTCLVAAAFLWFGPRRYVAKTVILPSQSRDPASGLLPAGLPTGLLGIGGGTDSNGKVIGAILRSKSLQDSIVAEVRDEAAALELTPDMVRLVLEKQTVLTNNDDGSWEIEVATSDAELSATIASSFPGIINAIAMRLSAEAAERKQEFLRGQLASARDQLTRSERDLVEFQRGTDAPLVTEQARQTVEAAATLQRSIIEKEVALAQLSRVLTPDNPRLTAAAAELSALRGQLRQLTAGQGGGGQVFLSFEESPELSASSARLLRQFTTDEQVYLSLTSALIQSQIDVNDKLPVVSVLDEAEVPRSPSGLPRLPVLAASLILGALLGTLYALVAAAMRRARTDPANDGFFDAWSCFKREMRTALPGRRRERLRPPATT